MSQSPGSLVLDAFWAAFPTEEGRKELGEALMAEHSHAVYFELGRALVCNGPVMPLLLVDHGLDQCKWDSEAAAIAERLAVSADEWWRVLGVAIVRTIETRDNPPWHDVVIASDDPPDDDDVIAVPDDPADWW